MNKSSARKASINMRKQAQVTISTLARKVLLTDVRQRQHIEACGLLTGSIDEQENWHVQRAHPLRNIFDSPVYFEFAPEDLLAIELDYPGQVIGAYHSHPAGIRVASSTDRANMKRVNVEQQIPWVWLILCGPFAGVDPESATWPEGASIIAYHHYTRQGLRQVAIRFEPAAEARPGPT